VDLKACGNSQLLPSGVKHGCKSIGVSQGQCGYFIDVLRKDCVNGEIGVGKWYYLWINVPDKGDIIIRHHNNIKRLD